MILLPFAIDPHGHWGPILQYFLYHAETTLEYKFYATRPNSKIMFHRATYNPCPLGILKTADSIWKQNKTRTFFGHSYTAPTLSLYTIQRSIHHPYSECNQKQHSDPNSHGKKQQLLPHPRCSTKPSTKQS